MKLKSFNKYNLLFIVIVGTIIRIYFFTGHIFSDDAYYSYLSYTIFDGHFANDYLGYPLFLIRTGYLSLTSLSFAVFGVNEFATIVFPFLFSILNLFLTYKITFLFTEKKKTALFACLLMAFFPTDIIFATINFTDAPNMFLINLGLFFLYKSYRYGKYSDAIIGGTFFFFSIQVKESIIYTALLLAILLLYLLFKKRSLNIQIIIGLSFILLSFLTEGLIYFFIYGDFLYRLSILNQNYIFSYYDFFPYTAVQFSGVKNYWRNLFDQIVLLNIKSVFLRRFYLFIPMIALLQSFINVRKNRNLLIVFWFIGTAVLMIFLTSSFTEYKPLDLQRSWYIYPLLMPAIILTAILLSNLKNRYKIVFIVFYIIGGVIMTTHYETYFNKEDKTLVKSFLDDNRDKTIFTDHFTKYGVDLIRNYSDTKKSERISGKNFEWNKVKPGSLVLLNQKHVDELVLQKYEFPGFEILQTNRFSEIKSFGDYHFYKRIQ